jgi:chlorite dismutase
MRIEVDEERSAVTDFQNERSQNGQCHSVMSLGSDADLVCVVFARYLLVKQKLRAQLAETADMTG